MAKNNATGILVNIALVLLIIYLFSITQKFLGPVYDIFIFLATPLILSIYLFYAFRPVRDWLAKKTKRPDLSAVLTFLLFIACTIGLFTVTISMIYNQAQSFVSNLDMQALIRYSDTEIFQQINRHVPLNRYIAQFESWLQSSASNIPNVLGGLLSNIGTFGSLILLILLGLFYLLKDEEQAVATIHYLARGKYYSRIMDILGQIHRTLETYISGQILVAGILGVLMFIGYTIIGLPYKLSLAAIALIFNFIPFIGPFLGAAPAVLVALTIDFAMVVKVIVVSTIVQQLEGNVITPNIMGSRLDIHPFVVIIAVMVCANLFGVLGALIASPLYMVLKIIIHGIRAERYHKGAQCPIPEEGSPNANDL